MAGEYRGKTALRELYSHVFGTLKVADLEPEGMTVGGDYVDQRDLLPLRRPQILSAGAAGRSLFRFRGVHKVCEIRPYYFRRRNPSSDAWAHYSQGE